MSTWDELTSTVWGEADKRRKNLKKHHGKKLGDWLADLRQYGAAWTGDAWQPEAVRVEDMPAFSTIGDYAFWDHPGSGALVSVSYNSATGESSTRSRPIILTMAGGKVSAGESWDKVERDRRCRAAFIEALRNGSIYDGMDPDVAYGAREALPQLPDYVKGTASWQLDR